MISVHTLPNGLRVALESLPFVRSVSFGIWLKNGSRNETKGTNGISHFSEHMMFKGTINRSAKQIADTMDAIGGQLNAFTSKEYTCFFTRTLDVHFDTALDVLQDMFFYSNYDEAEIAKERGVILEELNMYEDTPEDLVVDLMQCEIFKPHPLGFSVVGTKESISGFKRGDFLKFRGKHFTADKIVVAVAGNINPEEVLEKVEAVFGGMETPKKTTALKKATYSPGFSLKEKDIEQMHLCLGFQGLPTGVDESYAQAIIGTILGGGMSSRLFQKIREERGLVYSVYTSSASFIETGTFLIYAALSPTQLVEVGKLICGEIKGLLEEELDGDELQRTKEQLKSNFILSLESSSSRMSSIGRSVLLLDRIVTPDELIAKIDNVSLGDFREISERIFRFCELSISIVGKNVGGLTEGGLRAVFD